jgi:hypothetical protein
VHPFFSIFVFLDYKRRGNDEWVMKTPRAEGDGVDLSATEVFTPAWELLHGSVDTRFMFSGDLIRRLFLSQQGQQHRPQLG